VSDFHCEVCSKRCTRSSLHIVKGRGFCVDCLSKNILRDFTLEAMTNDFHTSPRKDSTHFTDAWAFAEVSRRAMLVIPKPICCKCNKEVESFESNHCTEKFITI